MDCVLCKKDFQPHPFQMDAKACPGCLSSLTGRLERYKITPKRFVEMFAYQKGACAICETVKELWVDMPKRTFRGLLCSTCASGLGCFRQSVTLLKKARTYVEEAKTHLP